MRIVKVGVLAPTNKGIPLGVQGENRATDIEFDTRPWFREYPSGTVSAVAKRYGDPAPYPITLDVEDGTAVWQVSDTDTAKAGEGAVELTMTSGGARVRSLTFKTLVTASLTDAPVDDDAWYGWLDKAVVKVDETVQSAQRKMAEVDVEWTGLKADVTAKVDECSEASAQAASDAHHAKVDAQATAKALESAEGSVAKAEAAATRAEGAAEQAYGAAEQASVSAGNASAAAIDAREASAQAEGWADRADESATRAAASEANAALSASSAADSAEHATAQKVAAENAKDAAESFKVGAEAAKGEAAASASNAESSATAAAKSASDAAASVDETLNEAKKYTDANTSNALVGNVSGKLLHVEDAWPGKPIGLTIDGACKQDGTPSPENPVPITVVENPLLNVTGRNLLDFSSLTAGYSIETTNGGVFKTQSGKWCATLQPIKIPESLESLTLSGNDTSYQTSIIFYDDDDSFVANRSIGVTPYTFEPPANVKRMRFTAYDYDYTLKNTMVEVGKGATYASYSGSSLPITLPAEHPYLAALPDGTHDEIVIDKDGNASLVARVQKVDVSNLPAPTKIDVLDNGLTRYEYWEFVKPEAKLDSSAFAPSFSSVIDYQFKTQGMYVSGTYIVVGATEDPTDTLKAGGYIYTTLAAPVTYSLGKLDIPSLPETISNVWIEANLTPEMSMTYKRDVNVVIAGLTAQIAELKDTPSNDDSTASHDAIVMLDNDVNVG